eukprot:5636908-Pleurochrysis_carterae.AAC.1
MCLGEIQICAWERFRYVPGRDSIGWSGSVPQQRERAPTMRGYHSAAESVGGQPDGVGRSQPARG